MFHQKQEKGIERQQPAVRGPYQEKRAAGSARRESKRFGSNFFKKIKCIGYLKFEHTVMKIYCTGKDWGGAVTD